MKPVIINEIVGTLSQKLTRLQLAASWLDIEARDNNLEAIKMASESVHDCAAELELSASAIRFLSRDTGQAVPEASPASVDSPIPDGRRRGHPFAE